MCAAGKGEISAAREGQDASSSLFPDNGLAPPASTNDDQDHNHKADEKSTTSTFDVWETLYSCGAFNNILLSCQETLCQLQENDENISTSSSEKRARKQSCNNFLDPHNFTIAHNDSMSTNATGDIDPDKIFAEQLDPVEALESMRLDDVRERMRDDSSISSNGMNGGSRRSRCAPNSSCNTESTKKAHVCPPGEIVATY